MIENLLHERNLRNSDENIEIVARWYKHSFWMTLSVLTCAHKGTVFKEENSDFSLDLLINGDISPISITRIREKTIGLDQPLKMHFKNSHIFSGSVIVYPECEDEEWIGEREKFPVFPKKQFGSIINILLVRDLNGFPILTIPSEKEEFSR